MSRSWMIVLAAAASVACTPPDAPPSEGPPPTVAEAPAELGPHTNTWNSAEFSRFEHVLQAPSAGAHTITLSAQTTSPGGETVAVYPLGDDGAPRTDRILFVVATTGGNSETVSYEFPAEGVPVAVVVENASGRSFAGSYTLSIGP